MATALTETAHFDSDVVVPEDGVDDETAASLVPAFQSLADRTQALKVVTDIFQNGGTVTPSASVTFGGTHGYSFTTNLACTSLSVSGTVNVAGNTALSGALVVGGAAEVAGNLTVDGPTLTAHAIVASGNISTTGTISTTGLATLGAVSVTSNMAANRVIAALDVLTGNVTATTLHGKQVDVAVIGANANTSYAPASTDMVYIGFGDSPLTADRNYTIDDTGAADGMEFWIHNYDPSHGVKLFGTTDYPSGFRVQNSTGNYTSIGAKRIAGSWRILVGTISRL